MMWSPILDGLHFFINTLFTLYLYVLLLRVLLPAVGADYYNPFSQFIVKLTQPIVAPLNKLLPRTHRIDTPAIVMLCLFCGLKNWILYGWLLHSQISWVGITLLIIPEVLELAIEFYFFAIIAQIIVSWFQPTNYNPFITILFQLTEPLLLPARKIIPIIGGIDLSALAVLVGLQLINIVIVNPLITFALRFTVGMSGQ
jgi:YggT family protein